MVVFHFNTFRNGTHKVVWNEIRVLSKGRWLRSKNKFT